MPHHDVTLQRRQVLGWAALLAALPASPLWAAEPARGAAARRIDRLVRRMTLAELVGQVHCEGGLSPNLAKSDFFAANPFMPPMTPEEGARAHAAQIRLIGEGGLGTLINPMDFDTVEHAQRTAVKASRLKIPLLFPADIIHGKRVVFPVPLGEAASWEPALAERTARAAGLESAHSGLDMTFAPMVDIGRDQRWGRVVEGAGEDVLLGSRFAAARVRGFQGGDPASPHSVLACPKHFAAYGMAEGGVDYNAVDVTGRVLREVYLPPFQAAFDAGAVMTMAAFNTLDGVPATGNRLLLTDILRGEMKFRGAVISDAWGDVQLIDHGLAADEDDAARQALLAGCDISLGSGLYQRRLAALVQRGQVPRATLEEAVRRVLWVKEVAGLFDDPFRRIDRARYDDHSTDAPHRALAREAGRRSVVLLKNEGGVLPLKPAGQRIALIGPFASDTANLDGAWGPLFTLVPPVSLEAGLRAALQAPELLRVVPGAAVEAALPGGIEAAVAAAREADVVVLALGEHQDMSGESLSRAQIVLPAAQQALAEAVAATGKPLVVVLRNGRALALQGAVLNAAALVVGWYLGTETGHALADVLLGHYNPSGRLPVSFPIDSGQQPFYYARANTGRPAHADRPLDRFTAHHIGVPHEARFPFGHGLSYSRIGYGEPVLDTPRLAWDGTLTVRVTVRNEGDRAAEEVVQLYVRDVAASVVRPIRELKDFAKVALQPGESREVQFRLGREALSFIGRDLKRRAEPGRFEVWVAPSATAGRAVSFELLAPV